ncbi:malic enzyme domain protein [Teladorsagia circumcincta]|uniref:Malic enzyme n=2 Tax=Teladorsagia circumcincta TaxID=45464 RepID=A0A2G9UIH9_TELCI|nr:malic enzyme domain protein [Teladorsagia circumcincta]
MRPAKEIDFNDPKQVALHKLYRPERITPREKGYDLLKNPRLNKGMAFSLYERHYLGIHGLLPPAFMTEEQQAYRVMTKLRETNDDLAKYIQLDELQDRTEKLYYRVLCDNVKELMPIVYTPTAIVVTDGERILGLGDLGAYGMGIPVGKLALYVALAGIQPQWCLPVVIDKLLDDPFYIGLRRRRVRGPEYELLLDNFMKAATKRFGRDTLIQFEDFAFENAFMLLDRYKNEYCVFNDDIQGTAAVVVAGLLATTRVTGRKLSEQKMVFLGAGAAGLGVAELCVTQMIDEGISEKEACDRIYMMDVGGLITESRSRSLTDRHRKFAKGKVLFASGSPFDDVEFNGKIFKPGQGNNSYIFPGVALGAILFKAKHIPDMAFLLAARRCAESVTAKSLDTYSRLYPRLKDIRELSVHIAVDVGNFFYQNNLATLHPEPEDKEMFIRSQIYSVEYDELINKTYDWPAKDAKHGFPVPVLPRSSMDDE